MKQPAHKFECVRVVVTSADSSRDYQLPKYIAEGLYERGELYTTQVDARGWDPTERFHSWRV